MLCNGDRFKHPKTGREKEDTQGNLPGEIQAGDIDKPGNEETDDAEYESEDLLCFHGSEQANSSPNQAPHASRWLVTVGCRERGYTADSGGILRIDSLGVKRENDLQQKRAMLICEALQAHSAARTRQHHHPPMPFLSAIAVSASPATMWGLLEPIHRATGS
jgi:hypothetical protein